MKVLKNIIITIGVIFGLAILIALILFLMTLKDESLPFEDYEKEYKIVETLDNSFTEAITYNSDDIEINISQGYLNKKIKESLQKEHSKYLNKEYENEINHFLYFTKSRSFNFKGLFIKLDDNLLKIFVPTTIKNGDKNIFTTTFILDFIPKINQSSISFTTSKVKLNLVPVPLKYFNLQNIIEKLNKNIPLGEFTTDNKELMFNISYSELLKAKDFFSGDTKVFADDFFDILFDNYLINIKIEKGKIKLLLNLKDLKYNEKSYFLDYEKPKTEEEQIAYTKNIRDNIKNKGNEKIKNYLNGTMKVSDMKKETMSHIISENELNSILYSYINDPKIKKTILREHRFNTDHEILKKYYFLVEETFLLLEKEQIKVIFNFSLRKDGLSNKALKFQMISNTTDRFFYIKDDKERLHLNIKELFIGNIQISNYCSVEKLLDELRRSYYNEINHTIILVEETIQNIFQNIIKTTITNIATQDEKAILTFYMEVNSNNFEPLLLEKLNTLYEKISPIENKDLLTDSEIIKITEQVLQVKVCVDGYTLKGDKKNSILDVADKINNKLSSLDLNIEKIILK